MEKDINKIPPPGYICHLCQQPGHFVEDCQFDFEKIKSTHHHQLAASSLSKNFLSKDLSLKKLENNNINEVYVWLKEMNLEKYYNSFLDKKMNDFGTLKNFTTDQIINMLQISTPTPLEIDSKKKLINALNQLHHHPQQPPHNNLSQHNLNQHLRTNNNLNINNNTLNNLNNSNLTNNLNNNNNTTLTTNENQIQNPPLNIGYYADINHNTNPNNNNNNIQAMHYDYLSPMNGGNNAYGIPPSNNPNNGLILDKGLNNNEKNDIKSYNTQKILGVKRKLNPNNQIPYSNKRNLVKVDTRSKQQKRSKVWEWFELYKEVDMNSDSNDQSKQKNYYVRCTAHPHVEYAYSGTTSSMLRHIEKYHSDQQQMNYDTSHDLFIKYLVDYVCSCNNDVSNIINEEFKELVRYLAPNIEFPDEDKIRELINSRK